MDRADESGFPRVLASSWSAHDAPRNLRLIWGLGT